MSTNLGYNNCRVYKDTTNRVRHETKDKTDKNNQFNNICNENNKTKSHDIGLNRKTPSKHMIGQTFDCNDCTDSVQHGRISD